MFDSPTVFVIGAGASAEYGIAVGDTLKAKIASLLGFYFDGYALQSGDGQLCETLKRHNHAITGQYGLSAPHFQAARHISDAMPHALSIDNFIDAHRGNEPIELCAKLGIVKSIINEEGSSKLAALRLPHDPFDFTSVSNGWIARLFQMLHEGVSVSEIDQLFQNVTLIVFNYDRCIETYLPRAVASYYGISDHEARRLVSKLNIVHPYGIVGNIDADGNIDPPFGSSEINLLDALEGVNTFSEGLSDPSIAKSLASAMNEAETIVFLGFSFHPMNLRILSNPCPNLRRIFGTTHGLSDSAVASVEEALLEAFEKDRPEMSNLLGYEGGALHEFELDNLTAFQFCTQYFRSLSRTDSN